MWIRSELIVGHLLVLCCIMLFPTGLWAQSVDAEASQPESAQMEPAKPAEASPVSEEKPEPETPPEKTENEPAAKPASQSIAPTPKTRFILGDPDDQADYDSYRASTANPLPLRAWAMKKNQESEGLLVLQIASGTLAALAALRYNSSSAPAPCDPQTDIHCGGNTVVGDDFGDLMLFLVMVPTFAIACIIDAFDIGSVELVEVKAGVSSTDGSQFVVTPMLSQPRGQHDQFNWGAMGTWTF